mgnify:CR=1 FL=1
MSKPLCELSSHPTARPFGAADEIGASAPRAGIGAVLDVDLDAIVANWRRLSARAGGVPAAAVVKADAYGLGAQPVAAALARAGCAHFFVAHLEEGIALRVAVPGVAIFVLHGLARGAEAAMRAHGLIPVLSTLDQIAAWREEAGRTGERLPAALHLDTGMARLGLSETEIDTLAGEPERLAGLDLRLVISHLAAAEEPENPSNERQRATFERLRAKLPKAKASFANSSGVFLGAPFHFDLLRPGAALYGVAPRATEANPMAPVVRLSARVLRVATLEAGTAIGYNGRFVTTAPTRVATVSVGYADGFLRSLAGKAHAGFAGRKLPIVGAVSMDMITVDVSALPEGALAEGDFIDVIGGDADDVDTLARAAGTIGYEILTSLGARYQRRWISHLSAF